MRFRRRPREVVAEELAGALTGLRCALVHGRMKAAEKQAVMQAFKAGAIDLLVATTVIEVGVDVPNASLMIIENSERLGLAQLHQLRGRVGRGAQHSSCVLLYEARSARLRVNAWISCARPTTVFALRKRTLNCAAPVKYWARGRPVSCSSGWPTWRVTRTCWSGFLRRQTACWRNNPNRWNN